MTVISGTSWTRLCHLGRGMKRSLQVLACCVSVIGVGYLLHDRMLAIQSKLPLVARRDNGDALPVFREGVTDADFADDTDVTNGLMADKLCELYQSWNKAMPNSELRTDLTDWSFRKTVSCPPFTMKTKRIKRVKISLDCQTDKAEIVLSLTDSSRDIFSIPFGDPCLISAIDRCCKDGKPVPNIIHYVWFGNNTMGFFQFLSFMSVLRFMRPCLILIHGDALPFGPYWDYFISIGPNVIHVQRDIPLTIFGQKLAYPQHYSDVMRLEALIAYGGVYIDWDSMILKPIEPLRKYDFTMGRSRPNFLSNGFLLCKQNASFLQEWYDAYHDYRPDFSYNSLIVSLALSEKKPELIHVEGYRFTKPDVFELREGPIKDRLFKNNYNWSTNYAMHSYCRQYVYSNATDETFIRTFNTTIGSVSRHILLGNKELCRH